MTHPLSETKKTGTEHTPFDKGNPEPEKRASEPGGSELDRHGSESEKPVPQEKDYKSSGFAAEGGDFDAAASGAGKEADRM